MKIFSTQDYKSNQCDDSDEVILRVHDNEEPANVKIDSFKPIHDIQVTTMIEKAGNSNGVTTPEHGFDLGVYSIETVTLKF